MSEIYLYPEQVTVQKKSIGYWLMRSWSGFSSKYFSSLENRAIVAPSITRWSADQLTDIIERTLYEPYSSSSLELDELSSSSSSGTTRRYINIFNNYE
jgi:hypothetical protein